MRQRFYEQIYPDEGDVVMTQYTEVDDIVIRVVLPQFGDIEGTIAHTELSRKKITFVQRQIKINCLQPATVIHINTEKGYIDLSKKTVSIEDDEKCRETFRNSKFVYSILEGVSRNLNIDISDLYKNYVWPIERKYGQASIYKVLMNEVYGTQSIGTTDKYLSTIVEEFKKKINLRENVKLSTIIRVNCFNVGGIDSIKHALTQGRIGDIKINLIKSPYYCLSISTTDKDNGLKQLSDSAELIKDDIVSLGGEFEVVRSIQTDTGDIDFTTLNLDSDNDEN